LQQPTIVINSNISIALMPRNENYSSYRKSNRKFLVMVKRENTDYNYLTILHFVVAN